MSIIVEDRTTDEYPFPKHEYSRIRVDGEERTDDVGRIEMFKMYVKLFDKKDREIQTLPRMSLSDIVQGIE